MLTHNKFSGQMRAVVTRAGDIVQDTGWFNNLILDQGLDRIGLGLIPIRFCHIGTGTTTPANAQVQLTAFTAASDEAYVFTNINSDTPLYKTEKTWALVFAQGAAVGNMAEIGIGWANSGATLFSRARILDGGGAPTALTLTALDQLTVYYKLTCIPTLTDSAGSVTISGTPYSYTARAANVSTFCIDSSFLSGNGGTLIGSDQQGTQNIICYPSASVLGAVTGNPTGTSFSGIARASTNAAYVTGNYYRDSTITLDPADGNDAGGIGVLLLKMGQGIFNAPSHQAQYKFTTPIPKNNTQQLTLTFRVSWGR